VAALTEARGPHLPLTSQGPLSHPQRARLALEILGAYLLSRRSLRAEPIESVLDTLRSARPSAGAEVEPADVTACDTVISQAQRLGRAVSRTLAPLPGDTRCLVRSLVLVRLLARRGISAKLVIGARTAPDFLAHAWVECAGVPILSPGDGSFGRLVEL
jgi:hypothetical protein